MNRAPEEIRANFLQEYRRWANLEWDRELAEGYPTLQAFHGFSGSAIVALEVIQRLAPADRATLARSLVKRAHKEATALDADHLSATESAVLDRWLEASREVRLSKMFHLEEHKPERPKMRAAFKNTLGPLLGKQTRPSSGTGLGYVTVLDPWSMNTDIDLGGRSNRITYFHVVSWRGQLVKSAIGPLEWLGVSATALDRVPHGREVEAAECISELVRRFLSARRMLMDVD